jgi:hypothetical protein
MIVSAFYGHAPNPFQSGGIGRVVREMFTDGTFGPIYFIRYNTLSGWGESNTQYPLYKRSSDAGFIEACEALLADHLMVAQWWDEERLDDDAFSIKTRSQRQAFNWFHRKDGAIVGLWKWSMVGLSFNEGKTWSDPIKVPTLQMTGAKISGRATADGRYALIYNPNIDDDHRWPLAIVTSDDGITFDNMLCAHGEVPPRRFNGKYKDFGPQYNRCIEEGNGQSPGTDLWVTYSMNKEDIWVSRVPVPVRHSVEGPVADAFDGLATGGVVTDWNIYSPRWAPVAVVEQPSASNKCLELQDRDPYDYARAVRVFPESKSTSIAFKVQADQNNTGRLEIDVNDRYGNRPVRIVLNENGQIRTQNGATDMAVARYQPDQWHTIKLLVNVADGVFALAIDGQSVDVPGELEFAEFVKSVERISFRTGSPRTEPTLRSVTADTPDVVDPDPDVAVPVAVFHVDDVRVTAE